MLPLKDICAAFKFGRRVHFALQRVFSAWLAIRCLKIGTFVLIEVLVTYLKNRRLNNNAIPLDSKNALDLRVDLETSVRLESILLNEA